MAPDLIGLLGFNVLAGIATLALITLGLGVIFGMMRIINLAHGEFMMLGAYTAIAAVRAGVNIWVAMLVLAPLVVGLIGLVLERTVIRFLYGRMIDTMLATWGLSLGLIGLVTTIFGNVVRRRADAASAASRSGVTAPASTASSSWQWPCAAAGRPLPAAPRFTRFGLIAARRPCRTRAWPRRSASPRTGSTWRPSRSARPRRASPAALLAPISGISPAMGAAYIAKPSSP